MPHTPGHTNNTSYVIYGTDEPYSGLTVEVGGYMYTTVGGALEGHSVQLISRNGNNTTDQNIMQQVIPGDTLKPDISSDLNLKSTETETTRSYRAPRTPRSDNGGRRTGGMGGY